MNLSQRAAPAQSPAILLICGREDFTFPENQAIAHQLERLGYPARLQEESGTHSHTFWKTHVTEAVAFIVANFRN